MLSNRAMKLQDKYNLHWIETNEEKVIDIIVNWIIEKKQNDLISNYKKLCQKLRSEVYER